jgi:uncharacterized small protein (DUF1192 family)
VSTRLARAVERRELREGIDLLADVDVLRQRLEGMFAEAQAKGHTGTSLKITSEQRSFIELLAKISYANVQSRISELEQENERLKSGVGDFEAQALFLNKLQVLSTRELEFLDQIAIKLETQDSSMQIIPDSDFVDFEGNKIIRRVNGNMTRTRFNEDM